MNGRRTDDKFSYIYSVPTAHERREIEEIRRQYLPAEERDSALVRLKKLAAHVKKVPLCVSVTAGVCGALIFGLGMAMSLEWGLLAGGIAVAAAGALCMAAAYPVRKFLLKKLKTKHAAEILRLSGELLSGGGPAQQ